MQVQSEERSPASRTKDSKTREIGTTFRWMGWIAVWLQLGLAVVSSLLLVFALSGRNFSDQDTRSMGVGIFWAVCGILVLLVGMFLSFRYTRYAKRLLHPNPHLNPKKPTVIKMLRLAIVVSLVGLLFNILGGGGSLGVLLAKAVAQPQGLAVYDPQKIIRALDIMVAMSNLTGITAHFVGLLSSLWLLNYVHRQGKKSTATASHSPEALSPPVAETEVNESPLRSP